MKADLSPYTAVLVAGADINEHIAQIKQEALLCPSGSSTTTWRCSSTSTTPPARPPRNWTYRNAPQRHTATTTAEGATI